MNINVLLAEVFSQNITPNTKIGGKASVLYSPYLLAQKLGISVTRLRGFRVVGSDVECNILGNYTPPNSVFNGDTGITFFESTPAQTAGNRGFLGTTNLQYFKIDNASSNQTGYINSFDGSGVESVQGYENVTSVPAYFARGCVNLQMNPTPNAVTIGDFAYQGCISLPTTLTYNSLVTAGTLSLSGINNVEEIYAPLLTTAGANCMYNNTNLRKAYVPSLTTLPNSMFNNDRLLSDLTTGRLTSIGQRALLNTYLVTFVDTELVTIIGLEGMSNMLSLVTTDLSSVTTLNNSALKGNIILESIGDTANLTTLNQEVFQNTPLLESVNVSSVVSIPTSINMFYNCGVRTLDFENYQGGFAGNQIFASMKRITTFKANKTVAITGARTFSESNILDLIEIKKCKDLGTPSEDRQHFRNIKMNCTIRVNDFLRTCNAGNADADLVYAKTQLNATVEFFDDAGNYTSTL